MRTVSQPTEPPRQAVTSGHLEVKKCTKIYFALGLGLQRFPDPLVGGKGARRQPLSKNLTRLHLLGLGHRLLSPEKNPSCDVGYLCANFSLLGPLHSRLMPDVRDRQTDKRQTDVRRQTRIIA